jgi:hypothetical protein
MKTITNYTIHVFALILGIVLSLSVSGQMSREPGFPGNELHQSHFLVEKSLQTVYNTGNEAWKPVYKSTQGSFPQKINHFYWDVTTIWMADYDKVASYNANGAILTEMMVDANTGDTTERTVYTYDDQGRETQVLNQNWLNGGWENNWRDIYTFDMNDNREVSLYQVWQGGSWVTQSGTKHVYTYNVNNQITEEIVQNWSMNVNNWQNWDRYIYAYDANGYLFEHIIQWWNDGNQVWNSMAKAIFTMDGIGVVIEMVQQSWDNPNSVWVNSHKYVDIVWHVWNGYFDESEVESYTDLSWNSGIWENYSRISTTYDAFAGYVQTTQYYSSGNWVNSSRYSLTNDAHGNFIEFTFEYWSNNVWVIDFGNKDLLTYSGNDVIQRISQYYDHIMMVWVNYSKELYSDFMYTQGIASGSSMPAGISLFPNPAGETLNIHLDDYASEIQSIEIVSMNGQMVYQMQIPAPGQREFQIHVADFRDGVYFVKLRDTSGVKVGKVIVR